MVKKIFLISVMLLMASFVYAEDGLTRFNLQGDTLYLTKSGTITAGIGYDAISVFDGLLKARAEYVASFSKDISYKLGMGLGIDIPKAVEKLHGKWTLTGITPTVGAMLLADFNGKVKFEPAFYLSIIKVQF